MMSQATCSHHMLSQITYKYTSNVYALHIRYTCIYMQCNVY